MRRPAPGNKRLREAQRLFLSYLVWIELGVIRPMPVAALEIESFSSKSSLFSTSTGRTFTEQTDVLP